MSDVNKQLLERWAAFGKAMQKSGSALPRHLIADTEQAISAAEQAQADDAEAEWRRLALQFDGHRMQALAHLRCLLENPESHAEAVRAFLAAPPLSGEQVLASRIAEQAQQADDADAERRCVMQHRYAIIDTDSGETIRYVDSKVKPPEGCKIVPTGYRRPSAYEKAVKAAALAGECEFQF